MSDIEIWHYGTTKRLDTTDICSFVDAMRDRIDELEKENAKLTEENDELKMRIAELETETES